MKRDTRELWIEWGHIVNSTTSGKWEGNEKFIWFRIFAPSPLPPRPLPGIVYFIVYFPWNGTKERKIVIRAHHALANRTMQTYVRWVGTWVWVDVLSFHVENTSEFQTLPRKRARKKETILRAFIARTGDVWHRWKRWSSFWSQIKQFDSIVSSAISSCWLLTVGRSWAPNAKRNGNADTFTFLSYSVWFAALKCESDRWHALVECFMSQYPRSAPWVQHKIFICHRYQWNSQVPVRFAYRFRKNMKYEILKMPSRIRFPFPARNGHETINWTEKYVHFSIHNNNKKIDSSFHSEWNSLSTFVQFYCMGPWHEVMNFHPNNFHNLIRLYVKCFRPLNYMQSINKYRVLNRLIFERAKFHWTLFEAIHRSMNFQLHSVRCHSSLWTCS